jgi:tetratricopeptide (TPR) repeat protein
VSGKELAPPVRIAERLEDAGAGSMIYVDERGQVRAPGQTRMITYLTLAGLGAVFAGLDWACWIYGGGFGIAAAGGITLWAAREVHDWVRLRRATALVVADRLDEAEALLARIGGRHSNADPIKSQVDQNLARVASMRGQYAEALAHLESALAVRATARELRGRRRTLEYSRVQTLVNLDRVAEARARFDELPRALEGDYLRLVRATTELYLAFAEGEHQFEPAYLREQAEIGMGIPSAIAQLALIAWAEERLGHRRAAADLLAIARARSGLRYVRLFYPRLADWMEARAAQGTGGDGHRDRA